MRRKSSLKRLTAVKKGFLDLFTLASFYKRMIRSGVPESQIFDRISNVWSTTALISALLSLFSFLALQTFGEYQNSDHHMPVFAVAMLISLFLNLASVFISLTFLLYATIIPAGRLKSWIESKADLIFIPVITLGGGVIGLLVAFPAAAHIIWTVCVCALTVSLLQHPNKTKSPTIAVSSRSLLCTGGGVSCRMPAGQPRADCHDPFPLCVCPSHSRRNLPAI